MATGSDIPKWISAVVAVLVLLGAISGTYTVLSSNMERMIITQEMTVHSIRKLDDYDMYLERKIESLRENDIRREVEMRGMQKDTSKLDDLMNKVLSEMKRMNEILIRSEVANGKTN